MKDLNPRPTKGKSFVNAKSSFLIGFTFIIIPSVFLSGIFMKYWVGITFDAFTTIEEVAAHLDKTPGLKWITPVIFIGLPLISACINTFAITHIVRDKTRKEFLITVKYRLLNTGLIFLSLSIVAIFIFHKISGYVHHTLAL